MTATTATPARTAATPLAPEVAGFIQSTYRLMMAANAATDQHHSFGNVGALYGDMDAALTNLLAYAFGADGPAILEMIRGCGECDDVARFAREVVSARNYEAGEDAAARASDAVAALKLDDDGTAADATYDAVRTAVRKARDAADALTVCPDCRGAGSVPASGYEPASTVHNGYVACATCLPSAA